MNKSRRKREALTAAAARLFWQNGYQATSIADISDAANVPLGNIYYHFRTKSAFAMAVADVFVEETTALLDEIANDETDPRQRLAQLAARLARNSKSRKEFGCPIALCTRDFRVDAPLAAKRSAEAFTLLIGFVARELVRTGLRPSLALASARAALAEWQGGMMLAHALQDATILAESFRRMEHILQVPRRNAQPMIT